ncbi:MAG: hypothetical protein ACN6ON_00540 [Sphingobacterium sp.]
MKRGTSISVEIFAMIISICSQGCVGNGGSREGKSPDNTTSGSFQFDSLVHYSTMIDLYQIGELEGKKTQSEQDVFLLSVLGDNQVDTTILKGLEDVGYTKTLINEKHYGVIDSLFFRKVRQEDIDSSCIHEFRDILVFYKNKKCIGLAKICFDCKAMVPWDRGVQFKGFGDWSDYDKLHPILREK